MKKLVQSLLIVIFICCVSCSEDFYSDQNLPDDVSIDVEPSIIAPEYDGIDLPNNFTSFIFYDDITGPDGLHILNKCQLLVGKEYGGDEGIYLARRGTTFDPVRDAFSTSMFSSPDDMVADFRGNVYVADGQGQTVFKVPRFGGDPTVFVTNGPSTSDSFNPFGVAIAPVGFNGKNVDPGDLIVCDNSGGDPVNRAVWAVNRSTGVAKVIAQGRAFTNGPINAAFNSRGTLFVTLNSGPDPDGAGPLEPGPNKLVKLGANGKVTHVDRNLSAPFIAIHPFTDDIYCKKNTTEIHIIPKGRGRSIVFATNVGVNRAGTQDMAFNRLGTSLYICHRNEKSVIEIRGKRDKLAFYRISKRIKRKLSNH